MFHGSGHDGAGVSTGDAAIMAAVVRQEERPPRETDVDATEAEATTLWTAAPGAVVVLPERYSPTYAYPSLIWLAGAREPESVVRERVEAVSSRNFVGIGLRLELHRGCGEPGGLDAAALRTRPGLSRYESLMRSVENWVRLHPSRRYVVGSGEVARNAIAWLLARPDWFAGAIAIDSPPSTAAAWHTSPAAPGTRRLLWLRSNTDSPAALDDAELLALSCLGLDVATHRGARGFGPRINRWMLEDVPSALID